MEDHKFYIDTFYLDKERNMCPESMCDFQPMKDTETGSTWEECIRCGRTRNLYHRV